MSPSERAAIAKEVVEVFEKHKLTDNDNGFDKFRVFMACHALMVQTNDPYELSATPREKIKI